MLDINRIHSFAVSLAFVSYSFWITNALGYLFFRKKNTEIGKKVAQACFRFRNQSKQMFFISVVAIVIFVVMGD